MISKSLLCLQNRSISLIQSRLEQWEHEAACITAGKLAWWMLHPGKKRQCLTLCRSNSNFACLECCALWQCTAEHTLSLRSREISTSSVAVLADHHGILQVRYVFVIKVDVMIGGRYSKLIQDPSIYKKKEMLTVICYYYHPSFSSKKCSIT